MRIEIRRGGFKNKGAELMLRAIIHKIRGELPEADLVMAPNIKTAPYVNRAKLGLYQKVWLYRYNIQWGYAGVFIPRKLREMYGMVLDSEIDVILDTAGFAYGDQWGMKNVTEVSRAIRKWKKQGTKVIFMPQAFGPFTKSDMRKKMKTIIQNADLIFARDNISLNYLLELDNFTGNIKIAPDLTNILDGILPENYKALSNGYCIIPNYKMIAMNSENNAHYYIKLIITCIRHLHDKGEKPFLLIHDKAEDPAIANKIANNTNIKLDIVYEDDPLKIKGIIGSCKGVISSRYHGLINAFSQGIPALTTSWSHKYEMLFSDYGFREGIIPVGADTSEIKHKIDLLLDNYDSIKKEIVETAEKRKRATHIMWDEVFNIINT